MDCKDEFKVLKHSFYLTVFVAKKGRENLTLAMGIPSETSRIISCRVVETVMLSAKAGVQVGFPTVAHCARV